MCDFIHSHRARLSFMPIICSYSIFILSTNIHITKQGPIGFDNAISNKIQEIARALITSEIINKKGKFAGVASNNNNVNFVYCIHIQVECTLKFNDSIWSWPVVNENRMFISLFVDYFR